ncbi:unnamed protein product [Effrenium voratum]|nr:unnamed protein product [Effrenium voratum]
MSKKLATWAETLPVQPSDTDPAWLQQFPLKVRGRHVVTQSGARFRLRGVNWYGASDSAHVVGGLEVQSLDTIGRSIAQLGFNVVRLPFSNEMLRSLCREGSINFEKNPSLRGLTALQVFDEVIHALGRQKLAVVLNNHTSYGEWCGGPDRNGLWFDPSSDTYTEEQWIEDWAMLARRYKHCLYVVGFDLRNEVRFCPWPFRWPSLGPRPWPCADWASAAATCGRRVTEAAGTPRLLVVERIIWPMRSLEAYAAEGLLLPDWKDHLVLGVHHYSWNGPGRYLAFGHMMTKGFMWFMKIFLRLLGIFSPRNYGDMASRELREELHRQWGHLLERDVCPVWVSEFGTNKGGYDLSWFQRFVEILGQMEADFAYWPLNVGPKPSCGGEESYGVLGPDWTPSSEKDERLDLMRKHGLLEHAQCMDNELDDFWQTHLTADAMVSTMRQAVGDTFQLLLTALWLYTREAWLRHLLDALSVALCASHTDEGNRGGTGSAPEPPLAELAPAFAPVAPLVEALAPCMQLVQSALSWFEEANIRHTAVTYRPLLLPMLGLQKLVDRYVASRKTPEPEKERRLESGFWLSLGGGSFFSALSSRSMAISRLAKTRCNVLLIIRPDEISPSFPKHMSLRGNNVDDSLFSLETIFRIGRITRTVSTELDVDGSSSFTGPNCRWPVIIIEVYSVSCYTEAMELLQERGQLRSGELLSRVEEWTQCAPPDREADRLYAAGLLLSKVARSTESNFGGRKPRYPAAELNTFKEKAKEKLLAAAACATAGGHWELAAQAAAAAEELSSKVC